MSYLLESSGLATIQARDGAEALELLKREKVDLLLLDIIMPEMGGMDVLLRVREQHPQHVLPVIMITGKTDSGSIIRALKAGANDYITKPVDDFDVVLVRVENQLRMRDAILEDDEGLAAPEPDGYCPRCLLALFHSERSCPDCGQSQPPRGWPLVARSDHRDLGRTLSGRYTLKRPLGIGSGGVVYSAFDQKLGRMYAVKVIEGVLDASENRYHALQVEIAAMSRLQNSHVVKLHEVIELDGGAVALVMDMVRGTDLDHLLQERGCLDVELALRLTRQIAQGLHEAHQLGLVHRDIKPDNIMLEALPVGGYMVKILDFGIAQVRGHMREDSGFYGTPHYASPEQIRPDGAGLDHRADIYSMGAMLYHMLHGSPPYEHTDLNELLGAQLYNPIPLLGEYVAERSLRDKLNALIHRMMAKAPEDRFQSLQVVYDEVEALLNEARAPGLSDEPMILLEESASVDSGTLTGKPVEPRERDHLRSRPVSRETPAIGLHALPFGDEPPASEDGGLGFDIVVDEPDDDAAPEPIVEGEV